METLLLGSSHRGGCVVVAFKGNRRELFNNPYEFPFRCGDLAIVEAERGQDAGIVRHVFQNLLLPLPKPPQYAVLRRASGQDSQRLDSLRAYEAQAIAQCTKRILHYNLQMNLVDGEFRFDGLKLTFYFTAEGRVDFRDLVRDLASSFHTRIELRQLGARDEVRRSDGYGSCGQQLCCVRFMNEFRPITTHMARVQNLILNPGKLSGVCGRLKCCLAYEYDHYTTLPATSRCPAVITADEPVESLTLMSDD